VPRPDKARRRVLVRRYESDQHAEARAKLGLDAAEVVGLLESRHHQGLDGLQIDIDEILSVGSGDAVASVVASAAPGIP
jgi:hypothetical protein